MKIYRVVVALYEGEPVWLGTYDSLEKATARIDEERPDWNGPNVIDIDLDIEEVQ